MTSATPRSTFPAVLIAFGVGLLLFGVLFISEGAELPGLFFAGLGALLLVGVGWSLLESRRFTQE